MKVLHGNIHTDTVYPPTRDPRSGVVTTVNVRDLVVDSAPSTDFLKAWVAANGPRRTPQEIQGEILRVFSDGILLLELLPPFMEGAQPMSADDQANYAASIHAGSMSPPLMSHESAAGGLSALGDPTMSSAIDARLAHHGLILRPGAAPSAIDARLAHHGLIGAAIAPASPAAAASVATPAPVPAKPAPAAPAPLALVPRPPAPIASVPVAPEPLPVRQAPAPRPAPPAPLPMPVRQAVRPDAAAALAAAGLTPAQVATALAAIAATPAANPAPGDVAAAEGQEAATAAAAAVPTPEA